MRVYLVCVECMLHIAGCQIVGVQGTSYCTLCKNTECLRRVRNKCFIAQCHYLEGEIIPPSHYTQELCIECKLKGKVRKKPQRR